ncbi:hypothetical protein F2Q70_00031218 [Brassica cretica]|uniref:Uncharacterized protein n=1 Tax=Brassica cretica TaxID=69181 RepID=A0A8S9FDD9_BRACR|nr:hypothetical protein F2Q70_00031218 [Brassica cretica]KAF2552278.1 hypothetical protein F2Q68_00035599 [Brassica cretica]
MYQICIPGCLIRIVDRKEQEKKEKKKKEKKMMVDEDLEMAKREKVLVDAGYMEAQQQP